MNPGIFHALSDLSAKHLRMAEACDPALRPAIADMDPPAARAGIPCGVNPAIGLAVFSVGPRPLPFQTPAQAEKAPRDTTILASGYEVPL